jgi:predicted CXXCH cytochrome family protein
MSHSFGSRTPDSRRWLSRAGLAAALFMAATCTSKEIVYRDREPFNAPPDASSGLLGYYTVSTKQTTCGNCHVGHQADWSQTHHASAYATLAANSHASATCYACHDVTENGNDLTAASGWNVVADSAYRDVQCESCHGPGSEHVKLPDDKSKWPLARLTLDVASSSCAACHTGAHHGFADEWAQSGHAVIVSPAVNSTNAECKNCHDGKTVLKAWGVSTNYVERDSAGYAAAVCAVCHNPHGSENEHQLRFPIDSPDPDRNLCMKCHLRRGEPTLTSATPHAPQGFVLLGTGGYRPPGASIDPNIALTTHASEANPRLCAGCHVNIYDVTDPATGNFVFHVTGHLFKAIPCIDATGKPVADPNCAYDPSVRSFKSCVNLGCHASESIAAGRLSLARGEIETLAAQIWLDKNNNGTIDAAPTDGGYLAVVRRDLPAELTNTTVLTPARGAQFNVYTFGEGRYSNGDKSLGVHNPFLARALLAADIAELQQAYGLAAPPPTIQALVTKALAEANTKSPGFIRESAGKQ